MDVGSWRPARESPNTSKKCNINQDGEGLEQCIKVMDLTSLASALLCYAFAGAPAVAELKSGRHNEIHA